MKPSKIERDLRYIKTNTPAPHKLGSIDINKLLSLGLVRKIINTKVNYNIPKNTPKWVSKYKFTRQKYGVTENIEFNKNYTLTNKGKRRLKNLTLKQLQPEDKNEEATT